MQVDSPLNWLYLHAHVGDTFTGQAAKAPEVVLNAGFSRFRFHRQPPDEVVACIGFDQGLDRDFLGCPQSPVKIAVIWEPREINHSVFAFVEKNFDLFFHVFSHDEHFLSGHSSKSSFFFTGGSYIKPHETLWAWPKFARVSISASYKRFLPGHQLRHRVIEDIQNSRLVKMGSGYRKYTSAAKPYRSYMFSVVIENVQESRFFTEKLVHSLLYRCVPVYWGAQTLPPTFDEKGILRFGSVGELEEILAGLSASRYREMEESIAHNQTAALEYASSELNLQRALAPVLGRKDFELDSAKHYFISPDALLSGRAKFDSLARARWE